MSGEGAERNGVAWNGTTVLITGAHGFLGGWISRAVEARGARTLLRPTRAELDLRDVAALREYLAVHRPDLIIHAAARVGGIGANRKAPGQFFYDNAVMGIHLIEEARRLGVKKFVCLGTICAYPKFTPIPFREEELWNGYPEETNAPYGLAKKMLLVQIQAYRQEYGFPGIYLLPVNLYGPGDHFDLENGHVIPVLIRKFVEAVDRGAEEVVLWGDGSPTREFLYVEDAAEAVVRAAERYDGDEPMNIGHAEEIRIAELARIIAEKTGFRGRLVWDTTKPNGQPRRMVDSARIERAIGWRASTPFDVGLERTIAWYRANR